MVYGEYSRKYFKIASCMGSGACEFLQILISVAVDLASHTALNFRFTGALSGV